MIDLTRDHENESFHSRSSDGPEPAAVARQTAFRVKHENGSRTNVSCSWGIALRPKTRIGLLRHYNPVDGRWINRDPIGEQGGLNVYAMVGNDPLRFFDLLGLKDVIDDTGTRCDEACLGEVELRVESPSQSVAEQLASDPKKVELVKNVINHQATLEQLGNAVVTGHTFIYYKYKDATADNGKENAWGFYPGPQWFGMSGRIINDLNHPFNKHRTYKVCPKKLDELKNAIDNDINSPPIYNLTDLQCTMWAIGKASSIGIKDIPTNFSEPYTLGQYFDNTPVPPSPHPAPKK